MRAVIQRVLEASVSVEGKEVSAIGAGLLVFLGVEKTDAERDAAYLAVKISRLRLFEQPKGKMNLSVLDIKGEVLAVSQFTLAASLEKGNRPSFDRAESPEKAERFYNLFMEKLRENGVQVRGGYSGRT